MKIMTGVLAATLSVGLSGFAFAFDPGPAPLLASGPVGLGVLAIAGAGYFALRAWRRR